MSQQNQANSAVTIDCKKCLIEKNISHTHYFDQIYVYLDRYPTKMTGCLCTHETLLHEKENKIAET